VDTLKDLRRRRGWSQKDLAEESGVGQDTISGIESGRHEPRPSTLRKLADALGVEVVDLFREPALPKAEAPRGAGQNRVAPKKANEREIAEKFISEHRPLLSDETLSVVVSGKLAQRAATRLNEARRKFNEANAAEDFPLTDLNDLANALQLLMDFTKDVIENHEQRFEEPYDPVEEAEDALRQAEKNYGTLS
jgi:transcriptional regulator with XRE-family HTH domain